MADLKRRYVDRGLPVLMRYVKRYDVPEERAAEIVSAYVRDPAECGDDDAQNWLWQARTCPPEPAACPYREPEFCLCGRSEGLSAEEKAF